jgi:predicted O-methyltransferase YrrM
MTTSFEDAWRSVEGVEGWMTEGQGRALFEAAAGCPSPGRIVEIGSFQGRSTIVATGASDGVEVVAIDPHAGNDRGPQEIEGFEVAAEDDHSAFEANLVRAGVRPRVRHIRAFSHAALDMVEGPTDVLYVDGAHRYRPALDDIRNWGDRVADGGTMMIHDSFSSIGVTGAIARHLLWSTRFTYVGRSRSLAVYRADAPVGIRGRLVNAIRQLSQLPWFLRNVAIKVLITAKVLRGREWPY